MYDEVKDINENEENEENVYKYYGVMQGVYGEYVPITSAEDLSLVRMVRRLNGTL